MLESEVWIEIRKEDKKVRHYPIGDFVNRVWK